MNSSFQTTKIFYVSGLATSFEKWKDSTASNFIITVCFHNFNYLAEKWKDGIASRTDRLLALASYSVILPLKLSYLIKDFLMELKKATISFLLVLVIYCSWVSAVKVSAKKKKWV